jgi:hypothetical protein
MLTASLLHFKRNIHVLEIPNDLYSQLTYSTDTLTLPDMPTASFEYISRVQTYFKKAYSIIQSHECMELPSISDSAAIVNSKPGFKKQVKQNHLAERLSPM